MATINNSINLYVLGTLNEWTDDTGLIFENNVVFYHKLDDNFEYTQNDDWTVGGKFVDAKIGRGLGILSIFGFNGSNNINADGAPDRQSFRSDILNQSGVAMSYVRNGNRMDVLIGSLSGSDISFGPKAVVKDDGTDLCGDYPSLAVIDDERFLVIHQKTFTGVNGLRVKICSVSGTTVTPGPNNNHTIHPNSLPDYFTVKKIDSEKFIASYRKNDPLAIEAIVIDTSGTTATITSGVNISNDVDTIYSEADIAIIDPNKFCVFWQQGQSGVAKIGNVSGSTITFGDNILIASGLTTTDIRKSTVVKVNSSSLIFTYQKPDEVSALKMADINGNDLDLYQENTLARSQIFHGNKINNSEISYIGRFSNLSRVGSRIARINEPTAGSIIFSNHFVIDDFEDRLPQTEYSYKIHFVSGSNQSIATFPETTFDPSTELLVSIADQQASGALANAFSGFVYPSLQETQTFQTLFWVFTPTLQDFNIEIERGLNIRMTSGVISIGNQSVLWDGAGINNLTSSLEDGNSHMIFMDFRYFSDNEWQLFTSIDGQSIIDQGINTSGSLTIPSNDTGPLIQINNGDPNMWVDEVVMWKGAIIFSNTILNQLHELGTIYTLPMNNYKNVFTPPTLLSSSNTPLFISNFVTSSNNLPKTILQIPHLKNSPQAITANLPDASGGVFVELWDENGDEKIPLSSGCNRFGDTDWYGWPISGLNSIEDIRSFFHWRISSTSGTDSSEGDIVIYDIEQ